MTQTVTSNDAARKEREHFVARAIKSRMRRRQPLDADALAEEAIWLSDRGTSYSEFVHSDDPEGLRACIFEPFRAEVENQLVQRAQADPLAATT
jgi:hypothetical protein